MRKPTFEKVTIIGPGLIGGSIGMALRGRRLAGEVVGVGHRQASIQAAVERGAIDRGTLHISEGVPGADLVVLCTSVKLIQEQAAEAIPLMKKGAVLSDVGSSKGEITKTVESLLAGSEHISYLGAHPLAGTEKRGVAAAREDLFEGGVCVFCPTAHTSAEAALRLSKLWEAMGARIREMDPATHDRLLGECSHLPHLVAAAMVNAVSDRALEMASSGFCDTTRIASGDPELWAAIFLSNRRNLGAGLVRLFEEISRLTSLLEAGDRKELVARLQRAKGRRDSISHA